MEKPSNPKRPRWSHVPRTMLKIEQVENNWAALGHANRLGLPINVSLDIHFERGDLLEPDLNASKSLRIFLKQARQWVERLGHQTAIIWTLENRGVTGKLYADIGGSGVHAHLLMHIPEPLLPRFHELRRRWARKAGMSLVGVEGVINFKPVRSLKGQRGKLAYMSKDLDPRHWDTFARFINPDTGKPVLHDSDKPSNLPIYGKKTGVSRNIDAKARADYHRQQRNGVERILTGQTKLVAG